MRTSTGDIFDQLKQQSPYLAEECLAARAAWQDAPRSEKARKWQFTCEIYAKHYKPNGSLLIPISEEAKALAAKFPNAFNPAEA